MCTAMVHSTAKLAPTPMEARICTGNRHLRASFWTDVRRLSHLPWPTDCSYVLLPRRWSDPGLTRGVKSARRRDWDAHHGEGKRERAAAHDDGVPRVQHRGVHRRLHARPRRQLLAVTRQHEEAVVEGEGDGARLPQKVQC